VQLVQLVLKREQQGLNQRQEQQEQQEDNSGNLVF
jgi:hypothetical protein